MFSPDSGERRVIVVGLLFKFMQKSIEVRRYGWQKVVRIIGSHPLVEEYRFLKTIAPIAKLHLPIYIFIEPRISRIQQIHRQTF